MLYLGIMIGIGLPIIILYNRHETFLQGKLRYKITVPLLILAIVILLINRLAHEGLTIISFGLIMPFIAQLIEFIASRISRQIIGRDFLLWLRHSKFVNNKDIQTSDKLISFSLLMLNVFVFLIMIIKLGKI